MRKIDLLSASAIALIAMLPSAALAQTAPAPAGTAPVAQDTGFGSDIVVTAQRQAQTLQEVPIAVSAFSAEALQQ